MPLQGVQHGKGVVSVQGRTKLPDLSVNSMKLHPAVMLFTTFAGTDLATTTLWKQQNSKYFKT